MLKNIESFRQKRMNLILNLHNQRCYISSFFSCLIYMQQCCFLLIPLCTYIYIYMHSVLLCSLTIRTYWSGLKQDTHVHLCEKIVSNDSHTPHVPFQGSSHSLKQKPGFTKKAGNYRCVTLYFSSLEPTHTKGNLLMSDLLFEVLLLGLNEQSVTMYNLAGKAET